MKKSSVTHCRHFFSFTLLVVFNTSLSAQLSGDAFTPANFSNDNNSYLVDGTLQFTNISTITDVTINISEGFKSGDELLYHDKLLPAGVSAHYNAAPAVLAFAGTASAANWNALLKNIYFRTTSTDLSDRKITFCAGNLPASAEGHFYRLSAYQSYYYKVPDYIRTTSGSLSNNRITISG